MPKLTIDDLELEGKKVLIRVDFNVPLDDQGKITDDRRIKSTLPTIEKVLSQGGKAILISHLGRPKGKPDPKLSLRPVAQRLSELLGKEVVFLPDCIGEEVEKRVAELKPGDCLLLENLRFHPGERDNDRRFSRRLAKLADLYINDAFGTAHRAHSSTYGVTRYFSQRAAGYLMEKELSYLGKALTNPGRPFVAVLGGAKISGKIDVIANLLRKVNSLLIGGGMAYTFLKAQGLEIGKSLLEEDKLNLAHNLLQNAKDRGIRIYLPSDCLIVKEIDGDEVKTVSVDAIPSDWIAVDIGPKTIEHFSAHLKEAKTVVWNGPLGIFEKKRFAQGTMSIAEVLAQITQEGATTIVGGGDTAGAVQKAGYGDKMSHISTGGGASLEFLEGKELPGVKALTDK